jgi:glyoxylase-like metal-dependent hydrolase (beta-lactamase superfamily II)
MMTLSEMKAAVIFAIALCLGPAAAQQKPEWCKNLPRPAYKDLERVSVPDAWFEVYRVRPGVFALYEPHQAEEVISYLIVGEKRAVLFDTGLGIGNIKRVVGRLTRLPVSVINSHTHNDHVGDNWRFRNVYGMDTQFTRVNAQGSRDDAQAELEADQICGDLPAGFDRKAYATRPFHISRWLHDGDRLALGGRTLQVVATPGHTPDSIALLDAGNGLLFTGDTYYPGPIYLYRPETDLDAYTRSLVRLSSMAPRLQLLLPSHNVPVAAPAELARVFAALLQVRDGKITPAKNGAKFEYSFSGFSFLMAK